MVNDFQSRLLSPKTVVCKLVYLFLQDVYQNYRKNG